MNNKELEQINKKEENKTELKKLSLNEFINKALEKDANKKKEEDIDIPEYGLVTFTRPTDEDSLEYLNASANAVKIDSEGTIQSTDLIFMNEAAKSFIYSSCPFLQNTELQEALNIKDPLDTPAKVFGSNNLINIANIIKQKFGDGTKVKRTIKN